jgi:phage repressor protein C with HTH and peptisase S24 domain
MSMVNKNLRFLRLQKGWTQKELAEKLALKQPVIGAYEEERATPPLPCLLEISDLFKISIDVLSRKDLSKLPEINWREAAVQIKKEVLAITVDSEDRENIELVSQKAAAGYLNGYQDPEYIKELPKLSLPVLPRHATYRAFEIKGDSMLPVQSGAIVFGEYAEKLSEVKNGKLYILVTENDGIVFKRVFMNDDKLLLVSDNREYDPYSIDAADIKEIWAVKAFFSTKFPDMDATSFSADQLAASVLSLQEEIKQLKKSKK